MGMAGEILRQSQGAENMKKRMHGVMTSPPVAILIGRDLVFSNRPPRQNIVFP